MLISRSLRSFLLVALSLLQMSPLIGGCRDVLLEFKGAYFLATGSRFRDIYNNGGALYGPELTVQACNNWYGFTSVDFFSKKGQSIGLCNTTKASMVLVAVGAKYFVPFCYGSFYLGLGFQPTYLKTSNYSPYVAEHDSKWGFGGIAKIGFYVDLVNDFLLDIFVDYSFVKVGRENTAYLAPNIIVPLKANISGAIFGAGLVYRF